MADERHRDSQQLLTKNRLEALVDGISGFAMTLLVVDLSVPKGLNPADLAGTLADMADDFFAFALAFLLLAGLWAAHHRQFQYIRHTDNIHIWINILMLLFIALMPFSTSLLANYGDIQSAEFFFGGNIMAIGLLLTANWLYGTYNYRLIETTLEKQIIANGLRRSLFIPIVAVVAMIVSVFHPTAGSYIYLAIPILLFIAPFRRK